VANFNHCKFDYQEAEMPNAQTELKSAKLVAKGTGEPLWFNRSLATIKVPSEDTKEAFDVIEILARRGNVTPLHTDPNCETFHVLEGELLFYSEGKERRATSGDTVVVPTGVPHAFLVTSPTARFIVLNVPGGHDRFFRAAGDPAPAAELPPPGPPDIPRLKATAPKFGIEVIGPPPFADLGELRSASDPHHA
jgi:quercetin dioxygenase-like cupin family protein